MKTSEQVIFAADGANIEYEVSGNGPSLLLIGGTELPASPTKPIAESLAKKYTVYCMNRRGWGSSAAKGSNYSMQMECDDAIRILAKHDIRYVFGLEYGGIIALHLALRYPVEKVLAYQPYFAAKRDLSWLPRIEASLKKGDYYGAMARYMKKFQANAKYLPEFAIKFIVKHFISVDLDRKRAVALAAKMVEYDPEQLKNMKENMDSAEWILYKDMLKSLSAEIGAAKRSESELAELCSLHSQVLLISDTTSEPYVYDSVDELSKVIPDAKKITVNILNGKVNVANPSKPQDFQSSISQFLIGE
jgi:pimeloyl-ACP methyl ester carboxylesterase